MHAHLTCRVPEGELNNKVYSLGYTKPFLEFKEGSAATYVGDKGSLLHCVWLTVIDQARFLLSSDLSGPHRRDCGVRYKLWPFKLNSACHVGIMAKAAGKGLELSVNKDILVCVNIYLPLCTPEKTLIHSLSPS